MLSNSMFIVGFVIFNLYNWFTMINWGHNSQEDRINDKEINE